MAVDCVCRIIRHRTGMGACNQSGVVMANANKIKGDAAEREVTRYLQGSGFTASRIPAGSNADIGDVWLPPPLPAVQVKNVAKLDLSGWCNQVDEQALNANRECGVVVHKRRGKSDPGDWYVTMTLETLTKLLKG
jgi:hypothetical protein